MYFHFQFLKYITIVASLHVLEMPRSVMRTAWLVLLQWFHYLFSMFQCQHDIFPLLSRFFILLFAASNLHAIIDVTSSGLFMLLRLGPCDIILSRMLLFVSWPYIGIGSICHFVKECYRLVFGYVCFLTFQTAIICLIKFCFSYFISVVFPNTLSPSSL